MLWWQRTVKRLPQIKHHIACINLDTKVTAGLLLVCCFSHCYDSPGAEYVNVLRLVTILKSHGGVELRPRSSHCWPLTTRAHVLHINNNTPNHIITPIQRCSHLELCLCCVTCLMVHISPISIVLAKWGVTIAKEGGGGRTQAISSSSASVVPPTKNTFTHKWQHFVHIFTQYI